uniref:Uncharacterized protein n=1 Tax=Tanacetum cinerariifolium TaxID=118510 RepID=A0A6L2JVR6_TANCI|nr:hypothetical protein [Tanacetum cinerariifolium]
MMMVEEKPDVTYNDVGRGDVVGYGFNLIELLRDYVILEVTDVSTTSCQRDVNTASYNISVAWLQVCILLLLMGILEYLWIKSSLETDVKAAKGMIVGNCRFDETKWIKE